MSLIQFLRILWAHRFITLASTICCAIGAVIVVLTIPPRYDASARVMLNTLKPDPVTGEYVGNQGAKTYVATQIQLIQDYRVAGQAVDAAGWQSDPALIAAYNARSKTDDRDFRRWLAQRVIDGTDVKLVGGTNILEISYTSNSPTVSKQMADALRKAYMDSTLATRREEATRNADWFAEQSLKAKAALDEADAARTQYERENGIVMQDDEHDLDTSRLRQLAAATPVAPPAYVPPPPSALAGQLAQLDAQIAQSSQVLGASHPELIEMKARRAALAQLVAQEQATQRAQATAAMAGANAVDHALEQQKTKVIAQRDKIERLTQLSSEVALRRDLFTKTMARAAQFRQAAAAADSGVTLLSDAVTPQKPSFPNKPLIMGGSVGLGAAMGLMAGLLLELLSRRVRGPEDLEWAADAPLLTVVPPPKRARRAKAASRASRRPVAPARGRAARA